MKQNGYTDKELQEIFAFLYFTDDASVSLQPHIFQYSAYLF